MEEVGAAVGAVVGAAVGAAVGLVIDPLPNIPLFDESLSQLNPMPAREFPEVPFSGFFVPQSGQNADSSSVLPQEGHTQVGSTGRAVPQSGQNFDVRPSFPQVGHTHVASSEKPKGMSVISNTSIMHAESVFSLSFSYSILQYCFVEWGLYRGNTAISPVSVDLFIIVLFPQRLQKITRKD